MSSMAVVSPDLFRAGSWPCPNTIQELSRIRPTGIISRMIWRTKASFIQVEKAWAPIHQSLPSVSAIASVKEAEVRIREDVWPTCKWVAHMVSQFQVFELCGTKFCLHLQVRNRVPNMVHSGSVDGVHHPLGPHFYLRCQFSLWWWYNELWSQVFGISTILEF